MTEVIQVSQLPVSGPLETTMRWNCDEFIIAYDRRTRTLTVEDFEGFEDDGTEITTVITDPDHIANIMLEHKPGWLGLDGFVLLQSYYGERWNIGTTPL